MSDHKRQVLELVRHHPSPTRRQWLARGTLLVGLAVALALAIFVAAGGIRQAPRPVDLVVATASGAACIATLALAGALGRGRVGLGRSRRGLLGLMVGTPLLLLAWKLSWSATSPDMVVEWTERPGLRCLQLSLSTGLPPLLALVLLWRDRDPVHGRVTGAAMGIAAGACSWVLIDLWCPVAYPPHLLIGHVLPMILLASLGAILGHRVIGLRERGGQCASTRSPRPDPDRGL